jgi:hypothetical protein
MKKILTTLTLALATITQVAAQYTPGAVANTTTVNGSAINQFILLIQNITNSLIPIAVTLAVLAFFWFLVRFIWKGSEDPAERDKMKGGMGWSIVALFIMVSIWGLVGFIGSITGVAQGGRVPIPTIQ